MRSSRTPSCAIASSRGSLPPWSACRRRTSPARCSGSSPTSSPSRATRRRRSPTTSGSSWMPSRPLRNEAGERLQAKDFAGTLLGFVNDILAKPRAEAPKVADDFWEQFDAEQELEEIRLVRPAAYHALPEAR